MCVYVRVCLYVCVYVCMYVRAQTLAGVANTNHCRFVGSSSSVAGPLVQLYCALSRFKEVDVSSLSETFHRQVCPTSSILFDSWLSWVQPRNFTPALVKPVTSILRKRGSFYALDGDAPARNPRNLILMQLGKSLELQLTLDPEEFVRRVLRESNPPAHKGRECYAYLRLGDLLLRSQLDAVTKDGRVFDLKTRATAAIRANCVSYLQHVGYRLTQVSGFTGSYEREFYDMVRSAFIKYGAGGFTMWLFFGVPYLLISSCVRRAGV